MSNTLEILQERGFLSQLTHSKEIENLLNQEGKVFYVGIDPTGPSLHIGHLVPILAATHLAHAGHKPIFVIGGATALIGDPSGKNALRALQSKEKVNEYTQAITCQLDSLAKTLLIKDFLILNNAQWLEKLTYIDFLREVACHFSVNRMLTFETYKARLQTGLSFLEFNYQVLQSYDFLKLFEKYNCSLQIGGEDQWGNIVAGIDLIRRVEGSQAYGMTFKLVTRSDGKKMGKTEKGAIFLDSNLTSPYDMYQYWRNTNDEDVQNFLLLYTFLPVKEIRTVTQEKGQALNQAKEILAYEVVKLIHGEEKAQQAKKSAKSLFSGDGKEEHVPQLTIRVNDITHEMNILDFCVMIGLCSSKGEARRIWEGGGLYAEGKRIEDISSQTLAVLLEKDSILMRQGKKKYIRVMLVKKEA